MRPASDKHKDAMRASIALAVAGYGISLYTATAPTASPGPNR